MSATPSPTSTLLKAISDSDTTLMFSEVAAFPLTGATVLIGTEQIDYSANVNGTLYGCTRGAHSTVAAAHAINSNITLVNLYASSSGTVPNPLPAVSGANLTNLNAGQLKGTITNDNATAGFVGEYFYSFVDYQSYPASGNFGDATSLSLTAGDWDVTVVSSWSANGSTTSKGEVGISTTPGNDGAGIIPGDNFLDFAPPVGSTQDGICVSNVRFSLAAPTTVYAKVRALFTVATPKNATRISARRVR